MFNLNLNKEKDDFANQMLDNYPDFDNILIKWNGNSTSNGAFSTGSFILPTGGAFIENFPAEFTVGGTPINSIGETLNRYTLLNGSIGTSSNIGSNRNLFYKVENNDTPTTLTYRVGLLGELPVGKVVGKKVTIFTLFCGAFGSGGSGSPSVKLININYTPKILHSDGTLTDIGTVKFLDTPKTYTFSGGSGRYDLEKGFSVGNFDGVTTIAGDRIVCDIYIECSNGVVSGNLYGLCPGFAGSRENATTREGVSPIQISIE